MAFKPTIKTLINKATKLGIQLEPEKVSNTINKVPKTDKYSGWELTQKIANKNLLNIYGTKEAIPKTLLYRTNLQSAMLSARMTEQTEEYKNYILEDNNEWYCEEKYNGLRISMMYTPEEGFKLYSNNRSTETLIPIEETQQVLWHPETYIGKLPVSFILDCECICPKKNINTGTDIQSELNSVIALMQLEPEKSKKIQIEQDAPLQFYIFDMPFYKRSLVDMPFIERRKNMEKLVTYLKNTYNLPFHIPKLFNTNKQYYFEQLVDNMHEGIMLKNANGIYTWDETRSRNRMLKMKRSLSMQAGEDIDVFIIGALESSKDKKYANYIGGFKLGVILKSFSGDIEHHVASISSLPDELRKEATTYVDGKPTLNPDFLYRVLTIDGFSVKQTSLRFAHAKVAPNWQECWRPDKNYSQCILTEDFLLNQEL